MFSPNFLLSPVQYLRQIYLQRSVYQKNSYQPACSPNIELWIIKHKYHKENISLQVLMVEKSEFVSREVMFILETND